MVAARFIAGDWGSSHLRLALCEADGRVLAEAAGPGAADCRGRFAETLAKSTAAWSGFGPLPVLLCGMVGSRQGWTEAAYLRCPTDLLHIAQSSTTVGTQGPCIMPGLTCINRLGAADFLRGEETQVLGALELEPRLRCGRQILVLPGTHSKWLHLADGQVRHFQTLVTGEIYAALRRHGVLVALTPAVAEEESPSDAFVLGLRRARTASADGLVAQLFECRSRHLAGELADGDEPAFLSGLLIGHELRHGLGQLAADAETRLCVVGTPTLARRYTEALRVFGVDADCLDGNQAAVAGLTAAYQQLYVEAS